MASRDIRLGPLSWAASIINAIGECRVLVVLVSANANRSRQMARELARADELGLSIIPLRLENVKLESDLAYFLGNLQWLDMSGGKKLEHEKKLLDAVQPLIQVSRDVPTATVEKRPTGIAPKRRVYFCYRRKDAAEQVGRLYDSLSQTFPGRVFGYSGDIESAVPVKESIQEAIASSVVLVIIGKKWLTATDAEGYSGIQSPNDFIRFEIATALQARARIIPILVDGAEMPSEYFLPADIGALARIKPEALAEETYSLALMLLEETLRAALDNSTSFR